MLSPHNRIITLLKKEEADYHFQITAIYRTKDQLYSGSNKPTNPYDFYIEVLLLAFIFITSSSA